MKKFVIVLALFALNLCRAQNIAVPESLEKFTAEAFQHYPKVREMAGLVELNRVKISLSQAGYLPIVKIDGSYTYLDPVSKISVPMGPAAKEFDVMPANNYTAVLNAVQPLIDLKTSVSVDKAESEYAVAADNYENFKSMLAYQTAQLYFGIIYLSKNLSVQQMQLDLLGESIELIQARLKNGDALKYDLVSTQVRYTSVENTYTEIQNQINKQYNLLNMLTGREGREYISDSEINSAMFNMGADSANILAEQNNFEIIYAKDKIKNGEYDVKLALKSMLPSLNLTASAGYKNGFSPDPDKIRFNYSAGLVLNIPIMPATRPLIQKEMALVSLENSRNALLTQRLAVLIDIRNAADDISKNKKRLENTEILLNQASQALELANERYKEGVITNLDLLTAQTNFQDAQLNRLQAEFSLLLAGLEINRLSGRRWW